MRLCDSWHALPFSGGALEQPLGLLVIGAAMRGYAADYALVQERRASKEPIPKAVEARYYAMAIAASRTTN